MLLSKTFGWVRPKCGRGSGREAGPCPPAASTTAHSQAMPRRKRACGMHENSHGNFGFSRSLHTADLLVTICDIDVFLAHAETQSPFTLARLAACSTECQGIVKLHIKVHNMLSSRHRDRLVQQHAVTQSSCHMYTQLLCGTGRAATCICFGLSYPKTPCLL
jgi:hypothetical protein